MSGIPLLSPAPAELSQHIPLWYQVAQHLLQTVRGRAADAPLRLPTEEALARHYGVGVVTLREALAWLEGQGLISRHRRRGTFINPDAALGAPLELAGTLESLFAQQQAEESELLERTEVPVPAELSARFPGLDRLAMFRRLRHQGGAPVSLAVNWMPPEIGRRVPAQRLAKWPMTRVLRDALNLPVARIEDTVEAGLASPEAARLLGVPLLSPILLVTGTTFDDTGRVIDLAQIQYRGDRFRFRVSFDVPPREERRPP
ncbi:GntR family transcriptional regulator [Pararoseomonas indoligenes]|uniref:GntR family transcriptional regulator n=1 Tax=Roseomonas indoligenes TaxID=2820811 RepID=A0A940N1F9_9PROT|nr:GntR family transcriptional regulator [Pararoseomonas indoligenes]MBP0495503.1 GntR family transcriptional regulator [Pararoseomonas indoligenes]